LNAARPFLLCGSVYGLLGVVCGAFAAHALGGWLAPDLLNTFHTAVQYQFYHAGALLVVGLLLQQKPVPLLRLAGWCFAVGVLLFSGSLYLLALSGVRWFGAITPLGGLLFLAGWAALIWGQLRGA
jgi:uncharacterized membrane protein YgdD (TMEM256/DUF423 family)